MNVTELLAARVATLPPATRELPREIAREGFKTNDELLSKLA